MGLPYQESSSSPSQLLFCFFIFFGCSTQHVGSQFSDQGSNPRPTASNVESFNHWTAKEVLLSVLLDLFGSENKK